jgi:hypothetical protein
MQFPCRCRISRYDSFDRVGRLACADGQEVRFGASACTDFEPAVGIECWIVAAAFDERAQAYRATVLNLTGEGEVDRLSRVAAAVRAREELARLGAEERAQAIDGSRKDPASQLRRIAAECGLELPPLYTSLALAGRLSPDSPSFQWLSMVQWFELVDVPDTEISALSILGGLVPFAKTPYGDWWCWWTDRPSEGAESEVLLCRHDSIEAEVFAPTFATWVARVCLTWGATVDEEDDEDAKRRDLRAWAGLLREGNGAIADHLDWFATQPVVDTPSHSEDRGFASPADRGRIIAEICGSSYVDRTLTWRS